MPDFNFRVERAESVPFAAVPMLSLKLYVENSVPDETIHSIVLHAQIQIEATRRRYNQREKDRLLDLFGEPDRWSRTLRSMLWTHANVVVPSFTGATTADLQIPCTFDFNVAATKYFYGVSEGEIPLNLLFSGSVFYASNECALRVAPISWDKEARFRLPADVWQKMMDDYYPNTSWLVLRRDLFDRIYEYKTRNGIATWEEALERLLDTVRQEAMAV